MATPSSGPRVLHFVDALGVGGTELALASVIERTRHRIQHTVGCVRATGPVAERLQATGIAVVHLNKAPGHDWSLPLRVARLCRRMAPDVVHTRNWGSIDAIIGARLARVPVVLHGEHGRDASDPNGANRRRNRIRRLLSFGVDRMVAVSDQLGAWLVQEVGVPRQKVRVLKNGVDSNRFCPAADRQEGRRARAIAADDVVIGTVGRLDPVKNQIALLDALELLRQRHPNLRLVIAGDGPERQRLEQAVEAKQLGKIVTLLGHADDVPAVLSLLDVFVLPSIGEGLCNTILEAMSFGLPTVATRVGGNPELVADGITGRLVPASDTAALTAALDTYVASASLRESHGAAARRRVLEEFTIERMADAYTALYHDELAAKGLTQ